MAWEKRPSYEWLKILEIQDESKQGIAATEYVMRLEEEIGLLKAEISKIEEKARNDVISEIMKSSPLKKWLRNHDYDVAKTKDFEEFVIDKYNWLNFDIFNN